VRVHVGNGRDADARRWTMSMAWMRIRGQTWPGAAASFLGMRVVMMVAMMLPSLVPMLWRFRQGVGRTGETCRGALSLLPC
jgi:predicted metal-binding membrane protein